MNLDNDDNIIYKSFIFVEHNVLGLLLLYCTRKPSKGPHFQLPGGHIDDIEFNAVGKKIRFHGTCFI
jgi:hypothetical protein